MHPLLTLLATRPQLLVDHAQAYAALFHEEFGLARASWQRQAILQTVAMTCLLATVVLAGVALMLWAITPAPQIHTPWVLWLAPLLPLLIAVISLVLARQHNKVDAFANLTRQIGADMAMLRTSNLP